MHKKASVTGSQCYLYASHQPGRVPIWTGCFRPSTAAVMLVLPYHSAPLTTQATSAKGKRHAHLCVLSAPSPVSVGLFLSPEPYQNDLCYLLVKMDSDLVRQAVCFP